MSTCARTARHGGFSSTHCSTNEPIHNLCQSNPHEKRVWVHQLRAQGFPRGYASGSGSVELCLPPTAQQKHPCLEEHGTTKCQCTRKPTVVDATFLRIEARSLGEAPTISVTHTFRARTLRKLVSLCIAQGLPFCSVSQESILHEVNVHVHQAVTRSFAQTLPVLFPRRCFPPFVGHI